MYVTCLSDCAITSAKLLLPDEELLSCILQMAWPGTG